MKNIGQILSDISLQLEKQDVSLPKREAENLLCDFLNCSRTELYLNFNEQLRMRDIEQIDAWVQQLLEGKPLAYISEKIQFYGCDFKINSSVLIPRQETEILVDQIVSQLKKENLKGKKLWDCCCGSGCIGIAIKKALPDLTVDLSDISATALELAKENAEINGVEVAFRKGDLLDPFRNEKTHYFVCNPPYISESEYHQLNREVKNFEPHQALVAGVSGLEYYERLAEELSAYLYPHGKVWLEIGYRQGEEVQEIFKSSIWKKKLVERDWSGHSRFFFLEIQ